MAQVTYCDACGGKLRAVYTGRRNPDGGTKIVLWYCESCDDEDAFVARYDADVPDIRSRL